ncbi:branched-chain-amino-acid aminotransferase-like protein 2, partial [Trifolium medium]|nr:branched-chain-amino-acid aminotransferase-like protein 2 [Trifolium medium]
NLDSKIHHNNLLNIILAKIEANNGNADDAIMLGHDGCVAETNATNIGKMDSRDKSIKLKSQCTDSNELE